MAACGSTLVCHVSSRSVVSDLSAVFQSFSFAESREKVSESSKNSCPISSRKTSFSSSPWNHLQGCHSCGSWQLKDKKLMFKSLHSFQSLRNRNCFSSKWSKKWHDTEYISPFFNGTRDITFPCFSNVHQPAVLFSNHRRKLEKNSITLGLESSLCCNGWNLTLSNYRQDRTGLRCFYVSANSVDKSGSNGDNGGNKDPPIKFYRRYSRTDPYKSTITDEDRSRGDDKKLQTLPRSSSVLDSLNEEQRNAVQVPPGPVRIVAGPGSGKTRVLTHRVAHLVLNLGVKPSEIMCITFTNRAKKEVENRLTSLLGERGYKGMSVGTFHKTAVRILRQSIAYLPDCGRDSNFVIFDDQDCIKLVKNSVEEVTKMKDFKESVKLLGFIDSWREMTMSKYLTKRRNQLFTDQSSEEVLQNLTILLRGNDPEVFIRHYMGQLETNNAVDFLDLLVLTVELLHSVPPVLQHYQQKYSHVLVDEFQDTDEIQYEMVRLLSEKSRNLFVVGDVDQAIYSWRGANPKLMQEALDRDFDKVTTLQLRVNYRSNPNILKLATNVIEQSEVTRTFGTLIPLSLLPVKKVGPLASYAYFKSCRSEASSIVREILRLREDGHSWDKFAILYRNHGQSRLFEEELMKNRIPFVILGGTPFYARKEIKDLVAYLRFLHNPMDEVSLSRIVNIPPRAIGEKTWATVKEWSKTMGQPLTAALLEFGIDLPKKDVLKITPRSRASLAEFCAMMAELRKDSVTCTVGELLRKLLERLKYQEYIATLDEKGDNSDKKRWNFVAELQGLANYWSSSMGVGRDALMAFLEDLALVSTPEVETKEENNEKLNSSAVRLMTIHSSKGLEFDSVFVPGLEESLLPSTKDQWIGRIAEERRLLYVAITRAEERLYLSHCESRFMYGKGVNNEVSRFMKEIIPWYNSFTLAEEGRATIVPTNQWVRLK